MKTELEDIQAKVSRIYHKHFYTYGGGLNLSFPHVPLISEAYLKNRIIIMGQETNTWYRKGDDDLENIYLKNFDAHDVNYGTKYYREFINGIEGANKGFWQFSKKLYSENIIPGPIQVNGYLNHCWINLFSVEAMKNKNDSDGRPTKNPKLREEVMNLQGSLLYDLMEILKPKILIALTGNKLNGVLFSNSLGLSFEKGKNLMIWNAVDPNGILEDRNLSEVDVLKENHPLRGIKIIQANHPNYFMSRINNNRKLKNNLEKAHLDISVSQHYQNVLFDWIRKQSH